MAYQDFAGKRRPSSSAYPEKSSGFVTIDDPATGTGKFKIDDLIGSLAPIFNITVDYTARQIVMYGGKLYVFKTDHPAGLWNAAHVEAVNLSDFGLEGFRFTYTNEYGLTLCDINGNSIITLTADGRINIGNLDISKISSLFGNNLVDVNFAKSFRYVHNDIYSLAVITEDEDVVFGIRTDAVVVCPYLTKLIESMKNEGTASVEYVDRAVGDERSRAVNAEENLQNQIDSIQPTTVVGGTNNPDDVFLKSVEGLLTFKDISKGLYGSNLKYVRDFASDVTETDSLYVVVFDHNLEGSTINLPSGCVLYFLSGCVYNGRLVGNNTRIVASKQCFKDISFGGTWNVHNISASMFADKQLANCLKRINDLLSDNTYNEVYIDSGNYVFSPTASSDSLIELKSNTKLIIDGRITVTPNGYNHYYLVNASGKKNIEICGNGQLIGDADYHDYTTVQSTHEWCHGIHCVGSSNVEVHGLTLSDFPGDGVEVDGKNLILYDLNISHCGRQGISVLSGENVEITNCNISDIYRTAPMAAIDVEPYTEVRAKNIKIANIVCSNCYGIMSLYADGVTVDNVSAHDCYKVFEGLDTHDVVIRNFRYTSDSPFSEISVINAESDSDVSIENSVFSPNSEAVSKVSGVKFGFNNKLENISFIDSPKEGSIRYENHQYEFWNGSTWVGV